MAKKRLVIIGIIAAAAAAGLGAWQFYFKDKLGTSANDDVYAYVTKVGTITGENLGIQNWYAGVVEAQKTIKVNPESGRKVGQVLVDVGTVVHPGDVLFEYDLSSIEDGLKTARLNYDKQVNETLNYQDQVANYEKQLLTAKNDSEFLSYSISLQSARLSLTESQYKETQRASEIQRLESLMGDTQVRCEVEGVIQKIDNTKMGSSSDDGMSDDLDYGFSSGSDSSDAFITILGTGNYRIKGMVNEQNRQDIVPGKEVIIRSRAESSQIWHGTMSGIDEQNASQNSSDDDWGGGSSDTQTSSTSYPFYVSMDSTDGLMLGQHVYIEPDEGQTSRPEGLWLLEYYIVDIDTDAPFVWADNGNDRLEKRYVKLGDYDEENLEYMILEGITTSDYICSPDESLTEGMKTMDSSNIEDFGEEMEDWEDEDWDAGLDEEGWDEEDWDEEDWDEEDWDEEDTADEDEDEEDIADEDWEDDEEWADDEWEEDTGDESWEEGTELLENPGSLNEGFTEYAEEGNTGTQNGLSEGVVLYGENDVKSAG